MEQFLLNIHSVTLTTDERNSSVTTRLRYRQCPFVHIQVVCLLYVTLCIREIPWFSARSVITDMHFVLSSLEHCGSALTLLVDFPSSSKSIT